MKTLIEFKKFIQHLDSTAQMPSLFIGHGSPMNGIELNEFSVNWEELGKTLPKPKAVLVISAHWFTKGTKITAMRIPPTIHDFGGFPQALFDVQYPASGNPELAKQTAQHIHSAKVELDHDWGLDHGSWTVLRHFYPEADVPVLQLSIDYSKGAQYHYDLAKELANLRKKGVLVIGSGNMIHNLRMINWEMMNGGGYDWALELNEKLKITISEGNHQALINFNQLDSAMRLAVPTPEHYLPLLYTLALQNDKDELTFFNDKAVGGSLTMTSLLMAN